MKKIIFSFFAIVCMAIIIFVSCSTPVGITSWKNPQSNAQVGNVVVLALFEKLTYSQPFEQQLSTYFNTQNLKSQAAQNFMDPTRQYTNVELKNKLDSVGADALLLCSYKGTNVAINTTGGGFYGGYRGWYGGGGQVWTTTTVNVSAKLYTVQNDQLIWTADMQLTDPGDINASAKQIAQAIIKDLAAKNMLKNPLPAPKK